MPELSLSNQETSPNQETLPNYETLQLSLESNIAKVSLNRPEKANSMNRAMWRELEACFRWADAEPSVRVVILAGNGKHFCSGIDLQMFAEDTAVSEDPARQAEHFRIHVLELQRNLTAIEECRKPVLAAIHGACIGGGVDMSCCCDMRYAAADAYFSIKEIDIGMVADVGTLQRLPTLMPSGVVRELAYTGRKMPADEAFRRGFVNQVFSDRETLLAEVEQVATSIAEKSPLAVRGSKAMLVYARDHSVSDGLNHIATWNAGMLSQDDVHKAIAAQASKTVAQFED